MNINALLSYSVHPKSSFRIQYIRVAHKRSEENELPEKEQHNTYEKDNTLLKDILSLSPEAKEKASTMQIVAETQSEPEEEKVKDLEKRDQEVKQHEMAHKRAGGPYADQAQYTYEIGPDGKRYAVGGHVSIDLSEEETPEETLQKARIIKQSATAPAEPSTEDYEVARKADEMAQKAQQEITEDRLKKTAQNNTQNKTNTLFNTPNDTAAASSPPSFLPTMITGKYDASSGAHIPQFSALA